MAKRKAKSAATPVPVPQSMEEANGFIREIGSAVRARVRVEADMNDAIAAAKADAEALDAPLRAAIEAKTKGLEIFCAAHRAALTRDGKVKSFAFSAGLVLWRNRPSKVTLKKVEEVLASLIALDLKRFIRTKEEVDKEAMLREPDVARHVPGVTIGSAGEDFAVEPFEVELEKVA